MFSAEGINFIITESVQIFAWSVFIENRDTVGQDTVCSLFEEIRYNDVTNVALVTNKKEELYM